jgi:SAM-dependent MidA family methyltransferase
VPEFLIKEPAMPVQIVEIGPGLGALTRPLLAAVEQMHAIEIDRGISVDELLDTIKSALLTAYRHTEGNSAAARPEARDWSSSSRRIIRRSPT